MRKKVEQSGTSFFGSVMSPHHSDQMSQRSYVSEIAPKLTDRQNFGNRKEKNNSRDGSASKEWSNKEELQFIHLSTIYFRIAKLFGTDVLFPSQWHCKFHFPGNVSSSPSPPHPLLLAENFARNILLKLSAVKM